MNPSITLRAPIGATGTIHASASGRTYEIAADSTVEVDRRDVGDLIRAGYVPLNASDDPIEADAARVKAASEAALSLHGA